jgi:UPF0716 protein FxsA
MRFLVLAIVMAFPVLDLYVTVQFAHWTGVPVWAWIGVAMVGGFLLLRSERTAFRARTVAAMHGEQSLLRGLVDSGRKVLAAMLLILPGIVSDLVALLLLALPINVGRRVEAAATGRRLDAIEGDWRRLD